MSSIYKFGLKTNIDFTDIFITPADDTCSTMGLLTILTFIMEVNCIKAIEKDGKRRSFENNTDRLLRHFLFSFSD